MRHNSLCRWFTTGLTAMAVSPVANAMPALEHQYVFYGAGQEEQVRGSYLLGEQVFTTIESKSKREMHDARRRSMTTESKLEVGYRYPATATTALSQAISFEGNDKKLKRAFLINVRQTIFRPVDLQVGYGYESQVHLSGSPLPELRTRNVKLSIGYRGQSISGNYSFTYKKALESMPFRRDDIEEHEIRFDYTATTTLKPYVKLESPEPFSRQNQRALLLWLGITRIWG